MAARVKAMEKRPLERFHEKLVTGDRGWFFANIAEKVSERRVQMNMSQRELAELCGTTQSAIASVPWALRVGRTTAGTSFCPGPGSPIRMMRTEIWRKRSSRALSPHTTGTRKTS